MSVNDRLRILRDARRVSKYGNILVVQLPQGLHGVITTDGNIVVPFGQYDWIDDYCLEVTRVKKEKEANGMKDSNSKWGIIDTNGKELIPVIYDRIWNYKTKPYTTLILEREGKTSIKSISELIHK